LIANLEHLLHFQAAEIPAFGGANRIRALSTAISCSISKRGSASSAAA
jgi:hypothetical protein